MKILNLECLILNVQVSRASGAAEIQNPFAIFFTVPPSLVEP